MACEHTAPFFYFCARLAQSPWGVDTDEFFAPWFCDPRQYISDIESGGHILPCRRMSLFASGTPEWLSREFRRIEAVLNGTGPIHVSTAMTEGGLQE